MVALPRGETATSADVLAYAADMAVELSILCAAKGLDALGARFLEAAAEARRARGALSVAADPPAYPDPNAAAADAT